MLVTLYTFDPIIFKTMNKAQREMQIDKIDTLGPYCHCLAKIIEKAFFLKDKE